jgi:hypothetical protein
MCIYFTRKLSLKRSRIQNPLHEYKWSSGPRAAKNDRYFESGTFLRGVIRSGQIQLFTIQQRVIRLECHFQKTAA